MRELGFFCFGSLCLVKGLAVRGTERVASVFLLCRVGVGLAFLSIVCFFVALCVVSFCFVFFLGMYITF